MVGLAKMGHVALILHCVLNGCDLKVRILCRLIILLHIVLLCPPQGALAAGDHAEVRTALHAKVLIHKVVIDPALLIPVGHHLHILLKAL